MCITLSADLSGVRVARSLIFYLVLCRSLLFFSCFFWPLCFLYFWPLCFLYFWPLCFLYLFDLWILTTHFVSSNSCSTMNNYRMCLLTFQTCIKRTLCNCNLNTYINVHALFHKYVWYICYLIQRRIIHKLVKLVLILIDYMSK
jgi:hypothetical protein